MLAQHMAQQQARGLNGSPVMPHGANGLPATSRLSAPPFTSPATSQIPLPNGHGPGVLPPQLRPSSAASNHGSPSMASALIGSPRPGSASSAQSPVHAAVALPPGSPATSALGIVSQPGQARPKRTGPNLQLGALPTFQSAYPNPPV